MKVALHLLRMIKGMFLLLMVVGMQTAVKAQINKDTTSLAYAFSNGHVHGHLRNVLMFTDNARGLSDYHADAIGGHLILLSLLNIIYQLKNGKIVFGKQLLNTPFINMQDNRMQPTAIEGLYADIRYKKWRIETGWLYNMAPRGTMKWFSVAGSMGRYAQGANTDGSKGNYLGNQQSNGIGLLGIHWQPGGNLHLHW